LFQYSSYLAHVVLTLITDIKKLLFKKNMKHFDELFSHLQRLKDDFEKYYDKNNGAAGTRIRKGMQTLKEMAQKIRIEVQAQKNEATAAKPEKATSKK